MLSPDSRLKALDKFENDLKSFDTNSITGILETCENLLLYLKYIKEVDFDPDDIYLLNSYVSKLKTSIFNIDSNFELVSPQNLIDEIHQSKRISKAIDLKIFNSFYSAILDVINTVTYYNPNEFEFNLFNPENSKKIEIKEKIKSTIELIKANDFLTEKAKESLIKKLKKVIDELEKPKSKWSDIYSNLSSVVVFLGALTQLGLNANAIHKLNETNEKLTEAYTIIQNTSITVSHNFLSEIFEETDTLFLNSPQKPFLMNNPPSSAETN